MSDPPPDPGARWPAVTFDTLPWEIDAGIPTSRTARRRHRGPYEAAGTPEIAALEVPMPPETAAMVDDASAEVVRFDAELGHEIAPFGAVLLRSESAASSNADPGSGALSGAKPRLSRTFQGTKPEARAALQRLLVEAGCDLYGGSTATVAELLAQFMATASLAPTTRATGKASSPTS